MKVGDLFQIGELHYVEVVYISGSDEVMPYLVVERALIPYTDNKGETAGYYTHEQATWINAEGVTLDDKGNERRVI